MRSFWLAKFFPFIKQIKAIQEAHEKFVNPLLEVTYWWFYSKKSICQEEETIYVLVGLGIFRGVASHQNAQWR